MRSQRLLDRLGPWELGDYEQFVPHIYDIVGHENLMAAAGTQGSFFGYSPHDMCCYRLAATDPFFDYLRAASLVTNRPIGISVDPDNRRHGLSPAQYDDLAHFLDQF